MTHNATTLTMPDLRVITTIDEFKSLESEWNNLYDNCDKSSVFSSWDWVFTWWEVFQDQFKRKLFIVCLYKKNKLVGIAPFQIVTHPFPKSIIQGQTLQFIGNGEAYEDSVVTEFHDFIVLPEYESVMIDQVSSFLVKNKSKWNFADFEFLLKNALILQCFTRDDSILKNQREYGVRFTIPQVDSFEGYQEKMGSRWSKMYQKKGAKLARAGKVHTQSTETLESINPALKQLAEMNCYRWTEKTGRCIFDSSRFSDFHEKVMTRLVPKGRAAIKTLYLEDEALASYYIFSDKNRIHYYQSGFYAKHANKYSPLFLLVCNEIGESIKNNQMFDFMFADDANSYKKDQYSCEHEEMYRLQWTPQAYRFTLFNTAKQSKASILNFKNKAKNKIANINKAIKAKKKDKEA